MNLAGLQKNSTVDFPGRLAAVLFVPHCNWDCFFCHNRRILGPVTPLLAPAEVWPFLEKRAGLLEGVVLSGGEPTLQPDLCDFARRLRTLGYDVKLDSNGSRPDVLEAMLREGLLDYLALDYKAPWHRYDDVCGAGVDLAAVQRSFAIARESGLPWELRTTVIPTLSAGDLAQMLRETPPPPRYVYNGYRLPEQYLPQDAGRVFAPTVPRAEIERVTRESGLDCEFVVRVP